MTGGRIYNLEELEVNAKSKGSVIVPRHPAWKKPKPAAFLINLPGAILVKLFRRGMYVYFKESEGHNDRQAWHLL